LTDNRPLRVAFPTVPSRLWAGGYNYQRNLFTALNVHCAGEITPVVFAGKQHDAAELAALSEIGGVEIVCSDAFAFDSRHSRLAAALVLGLDRQAAGEFEAKHIDAVFENARFFGWRLPLPAIAWFPDFQHHRLPHLFSPLSRWRRDLGFRTQIMSGRHVMLSSESALGDLRRFYPGFTSGGVSVVRFATQPETALLTADLSHVLTKHQLPPAFFYLPNQFWRHKNHQVVIDALAILKGRGRNVVVAASGSAKDPRDADHFDGLMRQVREQGLETNFRYLGIIPLEHVYALLRTSVALINPSRFEGWSTTVEEAKSFGVPLILSDIDVHHEQAGDAAQYFGLDDPATLANALLKALQTAGLPVTRDLSPDLDRRVAAFAADFIGTVRAAIALRGQVTAL
jgi:glycosyltransferase involved in cell wall biosynthesis